MIRSVRRSATALIRAALAAAASLCVGAAATAAHAEIAFAPCGNSNDFACGHLTVPLDPGGGATAAIVTTDAQARSNVASRHSAARELARLIGRLPGR